MPVDVGEPEIPALGAEGEPLVVEPQASTIGVRPNSPPQTTSVLSSSPRRLRSATRAAEPWSVLPQLPFTLPATSEWPSQPS